MACCEPSRVGSSRVSANRNDAFGRSIPADVVQLRFGAAADPRRFDRDPERHRGDVPLPLTHLILSDGGLTPVRERGALFPSTGFSNPQGGIHPNSAPPVGMSFTLTDSRLILRWEGAGLLVSYLIYMVWRTQWPAS